MVSHVPERQQSNAIRFCTGAGSANGAVGFKVCLRVLRCFTQPVLLLSLSFGHYLVAASSHTQSVKFEVSVILPRPYGDHVTRAVMQEAHHIVRLPDGPRDAVNTRSTIAGNGYDVLIVADDGIDPYIYTLLQGRMAPVQVSQIGTVACFLSDLVCWHGFGVLRRNCGVIWKSRVSYGM